MKNNNMGGMDNIHQPKNNEEFTMTIYFYTAVKYDYKIVKQEAILKSYRGHVQQVTWLNKRSY